MVAKESLSWEKKLYLSVWFQVNLILDIQSQHYELGHGVQRLKCLRYSMYVKVCENCEMFKNKLLKSIGEKWKVAPSPSKTYVCVRIPNLLSPQLISGHSCMLVYGRRVIFRAPLQFSISEVILWWCLWRLMQHFCLSNNIYHHCFLQYFSQMDYLG